MKFLSKKIIILIFAAITGVGIFISPLGVQIAHAINPGQALLSFLGLGVRAGGAVATAPLQLMVSFGIGIAGLMFGVSGMLLNAVIDAGVLQFSTLVNQTPAIRSGWQIVRGLTLTVFALYILYLAIGMILQIRQVNAKQKIVSVLIGSLLVGFSFFVVKVTIDASNIAAIEFYKPLVVSQEAEASKTAAGKPVRLGFSGVWANTLHLTTLFTFPPGAGAGQTSVEALVFRTGGMIFIFVASVVFFAAAVMIAISRVILIFLLIISPVGFMWWVFPRASRLFWTALWSQNLFPLLFFVLTDIAFKIVKDPGFGSVFTDTVSEAGPAGPAGPAASLGTAAFAQASTTQQTLTFFDALTGNSIDTILQFTMIIGLFVAALILAKQVGSAGAKAILTIGDKATAFGKNALTRPSTRLGKRFGGALGEAYLKGGGELRKTFGRGTKATGDFLRRIPVVKRLPDSKFAQGTVKVVSGVAERAEKGLQKFGETGVGQVVSALPRAGARRLAAEAGIASREVIKEMQEDLKKESNAALKAIYNNPLTSANKRSAIVGLLAERKDLVPQGKRFTSENIEKDAAAFKNLGETKTHKEIMGLAHQWLPREDLPKLFTGDEARGIKPITPNKLEDAQLNRAFAPIQEPIGERITTPDQAQERGYSSLEDAKIAQAKNLADRGYEPGEDGSFSDESFKQAQADDEKTAKKLGYFEEQEIDGKKTQVPSLQKAIEAQQKLIDTILANASENHIKKLEGIMSSPESEVFFGQMVSKAQETSGFDKWEADRNKRLQDLTNNRAQHVAKAQDNAIEAELQRRYKNEELDFKNSIGALNRDLTSVESAQLRQRVADEFSAGDRSRIRTAAKTTEDQRIDDAIDKINDEKWEPGKAKMSILQDWAENKSREERTVEDDGTVTIKNEGLGNPGLGRFLRSLSGRVAMKAFGVEIDNRGVSELSEDDMEKQSRAA